jgi:small subunit ribosomal protein S17
MEKENKNKILSGVVVSDKMDKTVVVSVARYIKLPKYSKYISRDKRYKAHDPEKRFKVGDKVEIKEVKPISKDKKFAVIYK